MQKSTKRIQWLMVCTAFFWAGAFIAGKYSSAEFPAVTLTFFRMFFSFIVIVIVRLIFNDNDWKVDKSDMLPIFIMAISGMIGYHVLFFIALKFTTATNTSIIAAINPILTMIIGVIIFKDKLKIKNIIAISISFFGIILVFTNGNITNLDISHLGDLIMFIAVTLWVVYSYISKNMLKKYKPLKLTALVFGIAALILFPFTLIQCSSVVDLKDISNLAWISVLYMAIFPSVLGYLIQQISIKEIGPIKTAQFVNLVPVFSMIMAYFILDESIRVTKIIASFLVIFGIILNNSNRIDYKKFK
ncbi:MAG: DMT family transporter [Filifactoraceae bacterium]